MLCFQTIQKLLSTFLLLKLKMRLFLSENQELYLSYEEKYNFVPHKEFKII